MRPFRFFLSTEMSTECDACGARFDLVKGGVCQNCKRVLCGTHLHGSLVRRLIVDFGAAPLCLQCRAGIPVKRSGA